MAEELPDWTLRAFSEPRMARYLRASGGDAATAVRLYWWNVEASAALYGPLHCLEVTLRNALHDRLKQRYGADWWAAFSLNPNGRRLIDKARRKCEERGLRPVPTDSVVAELSFGFWASLLSRGYDRRLWVPTLHRAFPHYSGRRDVLYDNLWSLVLLRNRVMHHEPIHHRDLAADHAKIYRLLGYMSPELVKEIRALDRFPSVLARRNGPEPRF
ncbi:hypothetical protein [Streptomyces macrosporus]|uniref:Abi family protein n=1 Tax=Streptomyces macrosporus TaxID=44032 RepID=A0ABN3JG79_9ACTN